MIKQILTAIVIIFIATGFAIGQNPIPNPGFENWTTHTGLSSYDTPDNWGTLNTFSGPFGQTTATKVAPGNSGNWAIRLQGLNITGLGTIPGILSSGQISTTNFTASGGIPVNYRPLAFNGYYKYDLSAGLDTATVAIVETKWNTTTGASDTVGLGASFFATNVTSWTSFTVFIIPTSIETPDTVSILFLSGSLTNSHPGALYLDDFTFSPFSSGINELNVANHFTVYPNPASDNIYFKYDDFGSNPATLIISDLSGRIINNKAIKNEITTLSTLNLADGLYFYHLVDSNNQNLLNGKFTIIK
jgi:hypothetical protein